MRMWVLPPALLSGLKIWHCCELWYIGHRCSSDLVLLWLWCRLAAAALIQPLAWEFPYAVGAALKQKKKGKELSLVFDVSWHLGGLQWTLRSVWSEDCTCLSSGCHSTFHLTWHGYHQLIALVKTRPLSGSILSGTLSWNGETFWNLLHLPELHWCFHGKVFKRFI